jgi:hypothetical protein
MTLVAHELAHSYCEHYKRNPSNKDSLVFEDETAKSWGFDIENLRQVIGPARD